MAELIEVTKHIDLPVRRDGLRNVDTSQAKASLIEWMEEVKGTGDHEHKFVEYAVENGRYKRILIKFNCTQQQFQDVQ